MFYIPHNMYEGIGGEKRGRVTPETKKSVSGKFSEKGFLKDGSSKCDPDILSEMRHEL